LKVGATWASRQCIEPGDLERFNCDKRFHKVGNDSSSLGLGESK